MRKSILTIVLCSIIFMAGSIPSVAAEVQPSEIVESIELVSPHMTYITRAECALTVSTTGNASVVCKVKGTQGNVIRTVITANLQQYQNGQWITIKTYTKGSNSYDVTLNNSCQVSKGYTYRVVANVRAYTSSSSEGRTVVSQEVRY